MPELPEVETIRLGLERYLVGDIIEDIEIRFPKLFSGDPEEIKGSWVIGVRRFGKGLVIDFENGKSLTIHVKMTGQLVYVGSKIPKGNKISEKAGESLPHKHTHVIFKLKTQNSKLKSEEEAYLYYSDIRRFGWLKVIETSKLSEQSFFKNLGPEPLSNLPAGRQGLTIQQFSSILAKTKAPIKPLLMDQKKIAGIGNIYANDALFLAKIHPKRPANSISKEEAVRLLTAIEKVLKKGLEVGGASEWQYVNATGETGGYQNFFKVYGKVGKPCEVCGAEIQKITMGGRGTFFCSQCQI